MALGDAKDFGEVGGRIHGASWVGFRARATPRAIDTAKAMVTPVAPIAKPVLFEPLAYFGIIMFTEALAGFP
jgi:hypothetical protein